PTTSRTTTYPSCPPTSLLRYPPTTPSTLFPSTTLFRSGCIGHHCADRHAVICRIRLSARRGHHVRRVAVLRAEHRPGERDDHDRSEEHTSELQSLTNLVCRLLLVKK